MRILAIILGIGIHLSVWGGDILFPVAKNGKWGLVSEKGEVILAPIYDYIEYNWSGKKFIYYQKGKMGLIDLSGNKLSEPIHQNIHFLDTNWVAYRSEKNWSLYIGAAQVYPDIYDSISHFNNTIFKLRVGDYFKLFNKETRLLTQYEYSEVTFFGEFIKGKNKSGKTDLIDKSTMEIIQGDFDKFIFAGANYFIGTDSQGSRIFNFNTAIVLSEYFDTIAVVNDAFFACKRQNKSLLFDASKQALYSLPNYDEVVQVRAPYLFYLKDDQTGIWHLQKEKIIALPEFDAVSFTDGVFYTRLFGNYGILSVEGKEILPSIYESITAYDNLYLVSQNGLFGLTTRSGKLIKDCIYKEIRVYDKNVKCFQGKKLDLLNIDANGVVQGETSYTDYMTISFDKEKTPGPKSESINFSGSRSETDRSGYEALGWFQKKTERLVKDSIRIVKGNWGLMYDKDSIAIQNRFPDIIVKYDYRLTECYVQKIIEYGKQGYEEKINAAKSFFFLTPASFVTGYGFFRLANHQTKKLLSKVLFQSINYNDFDRYALARALTTKLCLIDTGGQVVHDSLMYYGSYREDVLIICEGGTYECSKYKESLSPSSIADFFRTLNMGEEVIGKNQNFFSVRGGKWYFIDRHGKKINTEPFDYVKPFNRGRSIVYKKGKWGVVDTAMNVVVPIEYNSVTEFFVNGEQFFEVANPVNNTFLYQRTTGNLKKTDIVRVNNYCQGRWFATAKNGHIALVDTLLNPLTEFKYIVANPFEDGYAMVSNGGKKSVIDLNGKEYLSGYKAKGMNYLGFGRFEIVQSKGSLIVSIQGDTLITADKCKSVEASDSDFVIYQDPNKELRLYSSKKIKKLPKDADIISYCLENKTLLLKQDGGERIYSIRENKYLTKKMYNVEKIGNGFYMYRDLKKKAGVVSILGDTLIHAIYDDIEFQPNNWAVARVDKRNLIRIDMQGNALDDQKFTKYVCEKNYYIFYQKDGIGLFDLNGKMILPCKYDHIQKFNDVYYRTDSGHDLFYLNGEKVIPGIYTDYKGYSASTMVVESGGMEYLYTGYLNKTLSFQRVDPVNSDLFILTESTHRGIYNTDGKIVVPIKYHQLKVDRNYFQVRHFNSFGYYSTFGESIFDPI